MAVKRVLLCLFVNVLSLSSLEAQSSTNGANEFFLAFSANGRGSAAYNIYVTTAELDPVNFTVNTFTESKTYTVSLNQATPVTLDYATYSCQAGFTVESKGIHVKAESNKTISVYAVDYATYSAEAYLALPCQHFPVSQYVYYSMSVSPASITFTSAQGFALVVACEDSTEISTPTRQIHLNKLETFLFTDVDDITGIRFESDKPIAVLSGHECGYTSYKYSCYHRCCGPLVEQIPPVVTWGTIFLTASLPCLGSGCNTMYRLLAAYDDTHLQMNCSISPPYATTLTRGIKHDIYGVQYDSCVILTDKPVLVAEFGNTFMLTVPSIELYVHTYSFYVESSNGYVTIAMLAGTGIDPETTEMYLNDKRLVADWKVMYARDQLYGYITTLKITSGPHYLLPLDENVKIHVTVHDYDTGYYGYSAGYALKPTVLSGFCDPSCVHGQCTQEGVCSCSTGYRGEACDQSVMSECYVNSCDTHSDEGGPDTLCEKNVTLFSCECPQHFKPTACDDFWNDWNNEGPACNCSLEEQEQESCSLTLAGMTECPANMSVCLYGTENCTQFILRSFQCNCSGGVEPLNTCDIVCPLQNGSTEPPNTSPYGSTANPVTTQPSYSEGCPTEPCLNNGTCIYDYYNYYYQTYYCRCPSGYTGSRCQNTDDYNYNSDDYSDDSSDSGVTAIYVVVILFVIGIPTCVIPGCIGICYCRYQYKRYGSRLFRRSSAPRGGHRHQNRGGPPPEDVAPLIIRHDQLPYEYNQPWNWPPPQPRTPEWRPEEIGQNQMVPMGRVNEFLEQIMQPEGQPRHIVQPEGQPRHIVQPEGWPRHIAQQEEQTRQEVSRIPFMREKPQMQHLIKLVGERGNEVKIVDRVANDFHKVAYALGFEHQHCERALRDAHRDYEQACMNIFGKWLDGKALKPVTWATLTQALKEANFKQVAREVEAIVRKDGLHAL